MSYGLKPERLPPGPGEIGTPSITYSGCVSILKLLAPRICIVMLPSAAFPIWTPGTRSARIFSTETPGELLMVSEFTTDAGVAPAWPACGLGGEPLGEPPWVQADAVAMTSANVEMGRERNTDIESAPSRFLRD
jgi:hypothetical protein